MWSAYIWKSSNLHRPPKADIVQMTLQWRVWKKAKRYVLNVEL